MENNSSERVPFIELNPGEWEQFQSFYQALNARAIGFEDIQELWEDGYSIDEAIEYTDWKMEQVAKELFGE